MSQPATSTSRDILISRADSDAELAQRVDSILREAGHSTYIRPADTGPAGVTQRVDQGGCLVALMSQAYLASEPCLVEACHPLANDPGNERRRLIVLRIADCEPAAPLNSIDYVDLEPLLGDAEALALAVLGAVVPEQDPAAAQFASLFRRTQRRIIHAEVRQAAGFVGREAELSAIDAALWGKANRAVLANAAAKGNDAAAVGGYGGVGKSSLARQYAWLNRERYAGVWWVRSRTHEQVVGDVAALGARLMPGLEEMPDRTQAARIALDAIAQGGSEKPWLLIYDDVEAPEAVEALAPAGHAHVLITTNRADWQGRPEAIAVDAFPRPLAMEYLLARAHKADAHAAGRLADDLGGLPLALALARATCRSKGLDYEAYRAQLPELVQQAPNGADYPPVLFAAFDLALRQATAKSPAAGPLMGIAAHLASDRIPFDLLATAAPGEAERHAGLAALAEVALTTLQPLDDGTPGLSTHLLLQAAMKDRLAATPGDGGAAAATRLIAEAYPPDAEDVRTWPHCERLNVHAHAVLAAAPDDGDAAQATSRLLDRLGRHLEARANVEGAEPLIRRALAIDERRLGPEHPDVAARINSLGDVLAATGRFEEAEPLMRRALAIDERSHGPEHPSVARDLGNLGLLLQDTDRLAEAEPMMRRALAIEEKAFGADHPEVTIGLGNLALLLKATGRGAEAEPMMRRALAIDEQHFGREHPSIARDLNNLAGLLQDSHRLDEAEPMMRRALSISEASFGPDHPRIGTALNNLAVLLRDTKRLDEALPLMRRALSISEATFGPEHPSVALKYANFAELLFDNGRPAEADPYVRHAFLTAEKTLGPDHPETWAFRASYDKIIAAVDALARRDDAVEAGLAPASPERLARPDIPPPPAKRGIMGRIFRRKA